MCGTLTVFLTFQVLNHIDVKCAIARLAKSPNSKSTSKYTQELRKIISRCPYLPPCLRRRPLHLSSRAFISINGVGFRINKANFVKLFNFLFVILNTCLLVSNWPLSFVRCVRVGRVHSEFSTNASLECSSSWLWRMSSNTCCLKKILVYDSRESSNSS